MVQMRLCSCKWKEERSQQCIMFESGGNDDLDGEPCFRLNLNGTSEKRARCREAAVLNLCMKISKVNMNDVAVTRHHW